MGTYEEEEEGTKRKNKSVGLSLFITIALEIVSGLSIQFRSEVKSRLFDTDRRCGYGILVAREGGKCNNKNHNSPISACTAVFSTWRAAREHVYNIVMFGIYVEEKTKTKPATANGNVGRS